MFFIEDIEGITEIPFDWDCFFFTDYKVNQILFPCKLKESGKKITSSRRCQIDLHHFKIFKIRSNVNYPQIINNLQKSVILKMEKVK